MSRDQLHGKAFEDQIKAALFRGSADEGRTATSKFDIEPKFDKTYYLATSIKSAKNTRSLSVGLSAATRFWENTEPFRMIVGLYTQQADRKRFDVVHEVLIHGDMFGHLKGAISYPEVESVHVGMGIKNFPRGTHAAARSWAKAQLDPLRKRQGIVVLNPKIDSKDQRRLQCSLKLGELIDLACAAPPYRDPDRALIANTNHRVYTDSIGASFLPFFVAGGSREFGHVLADA